MTKQHLDIAPLPVKSHMSTTQKRLRHYAPDHLQTIIEENSVFGDVTSIAELSKDIMPVGGGALSAVYMVRRRDQALIVKLRTSGVEAEKEALEQWAAQGARVPGVLATGKLFDHVERKSPIYYIILSAVTTSNGHLAPTAQAHIDNYPTSTRRIGSLLGQQLALMHQSYSDRSFGEFADEQGANQSPYRSWNAYLLGYLDYHRHYLLELGVIATDIDKLRQAFGDTSFHVRGVYTHGDFGLRNSLVASKLPLCLVVFDPNPVIGDPSWDIAVLYNNFDFAKRKNEIHPTNSRYRQDYRQQKELFGSFLLSYQKNSHYDLSISRLLPAQIVQTIILLQTEQRKLAAQPKSRRLQLEVKARQDNLLAKIQLLTHLR